jgi:hypothetical protein
VSKQPKSTPEQAAPDEVWIAFDKEGCAHFPNDNRVAVRMGAVRYAKAPRGAVGSSSPCVKCEDARVRLDDRQRRLDAFDSLKVEARLAADYCDEVGATYTAEKLRGAIRVAVGIGATVRRIICEHDEPECPKCAAVGSQDYYCPRHGTMAKPCACLEAIKDPGTADRDVADGAALSDGDDDGLCVRCHCHMLIGDGDEPTDLCHRCVYVEVDRLRARERELERSVGFWRDGWNALDVDSAALKKRAEAAEARARELENAMRAAEPYASFFAQQTLRAALEAK